MSASTVKIPIPSSLAQIDVSSHMPTSATKMTSPHDANDQKSRTTLLTHRTLPPQTRKSLLNHLQATDTIPTLNDLLTATLTKSTTTIPPGAAEWSSRVHALALELLRSGACAPTFSELMNEITGRALSATPPSDAARLQGEEGARGGLGTIILPSGSYGKDGLPDVKIPQEVVETGIGFLKERVRGNIEIVDDDDGNDKEEGEE
ncbi:hypothetical protein GJ744_000988 [Endocarpon pusillum]|uniref:Uncharacterized protein n=1 Tax=Endocarpon pusillum TaxID=364733 RepID=A0A8H7ACT9_9EURO|nr:hypothetical protein GJ744_000988 [Endocarpon pusillum]